MSDLLDREPEDELIRYWQTNTLDAQGTYHQALAQELSSKVTQFDRKIFWRNSREYVVGLVVLIWSGYMAFRGSRSSIGMALGVTFVMAYLWWHHRNLGHPDPSMNVMVYEKALLERFDSQIRLLSRVKYWYLLPLYLPILWTTIEQFPRRGWRVIVFLAIVTVSYVFIGWLNERLAVGKLKEARAKVIAMMEKQESAGNE
jgi:hypothetical protein